jgi:hypothetical protein
MADCDCLVHECKSSHLDVLKLASDPYHVRYDGVQRLAEKIIFNCSLTKAPGHVDDASFCFQDAFCVHKKVYNGWYNPRCNTSGTNVMYIVKKSLSLFPRLNTITMEATVMFYDDLQSTGINYLLPLMPIDAIYIPYGFKALCPPCLGTGWSFEISSAFMELFPRLLPVAAIPCVSPLLMLWVWSRIAGMTSSSASWSLLSPALTPPFHSWHQSGPLLRISSSSAVPTAST